MCVELWLLGRFCSQLAHTQLAPFRHYFCAACTQPYKDRAYSSHSQLHSEQANISCYFLFDNSSNLHARVLDVCHLTRRLEVEMIIANGCINIYNASHSVSVGSGLISSSASEIKSNNGNNSAMSMDNAKVTQDRCRWCDWSKKDVRAFEVSGWKSYPARTNWEDLPMGGLTLNAMCPHFHDTF